jgi:hypothetical protein
MIFVVSAAVVIAAAFAVAAWVLVARHVLPGRKPAVAGLADVAVAPSTPPATSPAIAPADVIRLKWMDLIEAYRGNEAAADAKYLGKAIEVFVEPLYTNNIEKDGKGRYVLWLSRWDSIYHPHIRNIYFVFAPDQAKRLAAYSSPPGQPRKAMTVRGTCAGKIGTVLISDTLPRDPVIQVKDCELVE